MTVENRVIKRFESFVLGVCRCGCKENILIITKGHTLSKFKMYHAMRGEISSDVWKET